MAITSKTKKAVAKTKTKTSAKVAKKASYKLPAATKKNKKQTIVPKKALKNKTTTKPVSKTTISKKSEPATKKSSSNKNKLLVKKKVAVKLPVNKENKSKVAKPTIAKKSTGTAKLSASAKSVKQLPKQHSKKTTPTKETKVKSKKNITAAPASKKINIKNSKALKIQPPKKPLALKKEKSSSTAKPVVRAKDEIALKPVTKPNVKNLSVDQATLSRNAAIRARYKKIEIEYAVNSAIHILFSYLSTSSGLSEWFADRVDEKGDIMIFTWDTTKQAAKVLSIREDHHIRFRWLDMPEPIYFEFRIETDEITGDLALIITDFCEDEQSMASTRKLWDSQIDVLFHVIGVH